MALPLVLAAVDAMVAVYLLTWGLRRQRQDKPLVVLAGAVLLACGAVLAVVGWSTAEPAHQMPPAEPNSPLV